MVKKQTIQKIKLITPLVCIGIFVLVLLFVTLILPLILKSSIAEEIKMMPETYQYWGQSPGKTKSVTIRNFTFFNFTNPRGFLYRNETPVLHQIQGYMLQQRNNFTNYKYSQDMSEIYFDDWEYFTLYQGSRNIDQQLHVVNVAPLGFWYQLDKVGLPTFALQGFGGLFVELNNTFKTQAIGQGVSSQFLSNYTNWKAICDNNEIGTVQCNNIWQDRQYGLSDPNNFQIWVEFAHLNIEESQLYLQKYFGLTNLQMNNLKSIFEDWSITLVNILNNWFCNGQQCSSYDLTLRQLSSGKITSDPPSGDKFDSICDTGNVTCIGEPEISTFLKGSFKSKHPQQIYQDLNFSIQTFRTLFTPYNGTLVNIGPLTDLYSLGQQHDTAKTDLEKSHLLECIKNLTNAQSNLHAFVIWEWVKEFTSQFVIKKSKGGSQKNSGIGGVFSQAFYDAFTKFGQWIVDQYLSTLGQQAIKNCQNFVASIIPNIEQDKVERICSLIHKKGNGYSQLIQPCFNSARLKQKFRISNSLSARQMQQYCDSEQISFYTVGMEIHQKIYYLYKCVQKGIKICSSYQLSLKQFINSEITMNPFLQTYQKVLSVKEWNPSLSQFQYKNYLKQFYANQNIDQPQINNQQLIDLLSFDKLFSAPMVMELMLQNDQKQFQRYYYWKNMTLLKNFVKFTTIQVGFGGFTQKRTPRQLLFGYSDPFLQGLRDTNTMLGGDPSINPIVMLNEPNTTLEQAHMFPQSMYTGYSNISLTRQYSSIDNKKYITYNKTWFDGYKIHSEFVSPYKVQDPIRGSDAIQSQPDLQEDDLIYCMLTNLYRYSYLSVVGKSQMFGVDLFTYHVNSNFLQVQTQYAPNSNYELGYQGFQNLSFLGVPLYISKNRMYQCPDNWTELVQIYDEKGLQHINSSNIDNTVLKVEPYSGALFFASVRLQTNYLFSPDILFTPGTRMLPVTFVIRQGSIEEDIANQLFGALKLALGFKTAFIIISIIIIVLSAGFFGYTMYKRKKTPLQNNQEQKLLAQRSIASQDSVNINKSLAGTFTQ